ncbi:hypothetical protein [Aliivibrio fischeri]|uniref:hypothetical protein n=1 Tax=Aliivibrio fischeri TaxID=668 RepID=UPI00105E100A|nr:hypothetical protein [Aliivibrio fischeri]TDM53899.1 hypothetical protein VFFQA001_04790 [Aliivibrio fischeri]
MKKYVTLALSLATLTMSTHVMALNGMGVQIEAIYMSSNSNGLFITPKEKQSPSGFYRPEFPQTCQINGEFYLPLPDGSIGTRMHFMLEDAMQNSALIMLYSDGECAGDPKMDGSSRPKVVAIKKLFKG